jgi:hypothetical protein
MFESRVWAKQDARLSKPGIVEAPFYAPITPQKRRSVYESNLQWTYCRLLPANAFELNPKRGRSREAVFSSSWAFLQRELPFRCRSRRAMWRADLQQDTILFYPTQLGFYLQEELRVSAQILGGAMSGMT